MDARVISGNLGAIAPRHAAAVAPPRPRSTACSLPPPPPPRRAPRDCTVCPPTPHTGCVIDVSCTGWSAARAGLLQQLCPLLSQPLLVPGLQRDHTRLPRPRPPLHLGRLCPARRAGVRKLDLCTVQLVAEQGRLQGGSRHLRLQLLAVGLRCGTVPVNGVQSQQERGWRTWTVQLDLAPQAQHPDLRSFSVHI